MKILLNISTLIFIAVVIVVAFKFKTKSKTPSEVSISLPYKFTTEKAEQLSIDAFELKKVKKYDEAIFLCQKALTIEQTNPKLLFDISDCYSKKGDLNSS
jgi:tetratricopeptide (TPR) repeat protein